MKRYILLLTVLIASCFAGFAQAPTGVWHGQYDAPKGEGSYYYQLDFVSDSTVHITKQMKGGDVRESKKFTADGATIIFGEQDGDIIPDFNNAKLTLDKDSNWVYTKDQVRFIIRPYNGMLSALHLIVALIAMIILNELFRRYKIPTLMFYILIPFVLIPILMKFSEHEPIYWFKWVKLYSVVFACIWFTGMRYTKLGLLKFAKFIAMGFLAVNIIEAVIQDFSMHYSANLMNAIAGVISIITLDKWGGIFIEDTKKRDMLWPAMTVLWIIAYDVWNIVFVYLNFPGSTGNQLVVLLACTIPALLIKKGTWLQARAFTLAAWFMYFFVCPEFVESKMLFIPRPEWLGIAAGAFSLLINGVLLFVHFTPKVKVRLQKGRH